MHKKKHVALQPKVKDTVERNPLGRCSYCKATFRTVTLADIHFEEVHPELKFLDMCEQASNLWKETSVLKSGDNFQLI
jgi:glutaredoxin